MISEKFTSYFLFFAYHFLPLYLVKSVNSDALTEPIYEYLKDLCPIGQLPLTSFKAVKTCANLCPLGSSCYRGICCVPPPQCKHPLYRVSTGFPCLPTVKNNCPEGSQCTSSGQDGMYICCSSKNVLKYGRNFPMVSNRLKPTVAVNKKTWGEKVDKQAKNQLVPDSSQICPKSHPIIAHDGKSLVLCRDCAQGVCAKFRTSNVEVCCQNSDDICGAGSQVLMDSLVPRDCSRKQCGKGYECSLTPAGLRVCCSLAKCPNGQFARSVCAAGCLRSEKCTTIQEEMWCCPAEEKSTTSFGQFECRNEAKSTGEICNPAFPICSQGADCELNKSQDAHICCRKYRSKLSDRKTLVAPPPPFFYSSTTPLPFIMTTTTKMDTVIAATQEPVVTVPNCLDAQSRPLIENGLPHLCSRPEDPCHRQGYTCQESDIDEVFVCCTARSPPIVPSVTTTFPSLFKTTSNSVVLIPDGTVKATCPFSYMPPKNDQGEGQRCLTLFSFDCPFGYTCLPSSTTDSYLCCIRKPVI